MDYCLGHCENSRGRVKVFKIFRNHNTLEDVGNHQLQKRAERGNYIFINFNKREAILQANSWKLTGS
jgi:hypothetical protein